MPPLSHATLAEQAYEELRARIVSGQLPAGQRLLAEELANELAISPTPVKEALAALERDGLVQGTARRASSVRRFTPADIAEIYDARILIETHALASLLQERRVEATFIATLQGIFAEHMRHAERRTPAGLAEAIRCDREFHEAIVAQGRNSVLAGWHRIVLRQTQTIRFYSLAHYDVSRARNEHGAIIAALGREDPVAVEALRRHLLASRAEMLSRPADHLPVRP